MRCTACSGEFRVVDLATFSRRAWWWYWLTIPLVGAPGAAGMIAPLLDRLVAGYSLEVRITFWALAASPVYLYVVLCWMFAKHRLARWYFGAIPAALVLTVANAMAIAAAVVMRM